MATNPNFASTPRLLSASFTQPQSLAHAPADVSALTQVFAAGPAGSRLEQIVFVQVDAGSFTVGNGTFLVFTQQGSGAPLLFTTVASPAPVLGARTVLMFDLALPPGMSVWVGLQHNAASGTIHVHGVGGDF